MVIDDRGWMYRFYAHSNYSLFFGFVQFWLAHTPSIGENEKDAARREAWNQYQKFVEYVATQMAGGHRFIDDLVQDTIADEDELHQAISNNAE